MCDQCEVNNGKILGEAAPKGTCSPGREQSRRQAWVSCLSDYCSPLVKGRKGLSRKVERRCVLASPILYLLFMNMQTYFVFLKSVSCQSLAFDFFCIPVSNGVGFYPGTVL